MLTQHMKWLRKAKDLYWRHQYPALNFVDTSTVFQQDHNGYTHQDPGLLTHLFEKERPDLVKEYLPADTNSLMAVSNKAFRNQECINLFVTSKHPRAQWFSIDEATQLADNGLGYIDWASTDQGTEPDVVFASSGTEPTEEALAAIDILHDNFPELKIRYINIIEIMRLMNTDKNPEGLTDAEFNSYFTTDKPVIFAWHGFRDMIQALFFDRANRNVHIHSYEENGDITTPFDMRVLNELDRFHLAKDAIQSVPGYEQKSAAFVAKMDNMINKHNHYIRSEGKDLPEVTNWTWKGLK